MPNQGCWLSKKIKIEKKLSQITAEMVSKAFIRRWRSDRNKVVCAWEQEVRIDRFTDQKFFVNVLGKPLFMP